MYGWLRAEVTAGVDRSMPQRTTLEFYARCPADGCGYRDARWFGGPALDSGSGTHYHRVSCPRCVSQTVKAQVERRRQATEDAA